MKQHLPGLAAEQPTRPGEAVSARRDLAVGAAFAAVGLVAWALTWAEGLPFHAALFPRMIATALVIGGATLAVKAVRTRLRTAGREATTTRDTSRGWQQTALVVVGIALYVAVLPLAGYPVATLVFLTVSMRALGYRPWWRVIVISVAVVGVSYWLFFDFLLLPTISPWWWR